MLTNDVVSFEQPDPGKHCRRQQEQHQCWKMTPMLLLLAKMKTTSPENLPIYYKAYQFISFIQETEICHLIVQQNP